MKSKALTKKQITEAFTVVGLIVATICMVALPYLVQVKGEIWVSSLALIKGWFSFWAILPAAVVFMVLRLHYKVPLLKTFVALFFFNLVSALMAVFITPSVALGLFYFITGSSFWVDSGILVLIITLIDYLVLKTVFKINKLEIFNIMFLLLFVANFISLLIGFKYGEVIPYTMVG